MKRICLILIPFAAAAASAQVPPALDPPPAIGTAPTSVDRYPERSIAFKGGVTSLPDQVYVQHPGFRPQTLDIYLPPATVPKPRQGFPLILHVHGGGWSAGDARKAGAIVDLPGLFAQLAGRGYVVASLNYRLSGEAPFPAAAQDVKMALRWLRSRADRYRMAPDRAAIWGGSAGGHLAGLAAVSCNLPTLNPLKEKLADAAEPGGAAAPQEATRAADGKRALAAASECVQAAVTWYGVFDFATLDAQSGRPAIPEPFLGCSDGDCTEAIKAASPITYVTSASPPMLLIHGTADRTVPFAQSTEMATALKAAGVPVTLIPLPGIDHSFIGKTPEATRTATLQALAATFDFFDRTVGSRAPLH